MAINANIMLYKYFLKLLQFSNNVLKKLLDYKSIRLKTILNIIGILLL